MCEFGLAFKAHGCGEGGREREREGGREGRVGRKCLFDPIITSARMPRIRSDQEEGRTRTATTRNNRLAGLRIQSYNIPK